MAGAGSGGVSAAIQASRMGASVALLEGPEESELWTPLVVKLVPSALVCSSDCGTKLTPQPPRIVVFSLRR
ncbi:MAG TPA: hypothetical protein VGM23_15030 [Armatimonadota bacterium]